MTPKYHIKTDTGWLTTYSPTSLSWGLWCNAKFLSPTEVSEALKVITEAGEIDVITAERAG